MHPETPSFPTPNEFPFSYGALALIAVYLIAGLAAYGGYKNFGAVGKMVYAMLFPVHLLIVSLISGISADHRFITVPLLLVIGGVITWCSRNLEPGGPIGPAIFFGLLVLTACQSSGKWDEKKKFLE